MDGIAVVERGALDAQIVYERPVEAVEIFDHEAAALEVDSRMVI